MTSDADFLLIGGGLASAIATETLPKEGALAINRSLRNKTSQKLKVALLQADNLQYHVLTQRIDRHV